MGMAIGELFESVINSQVKLVVPMDTVSVSFFFSEALVFTFFLVAAALAVGRGP